MFREHPDGFIYVNDTKLTLAKFQELEPAYESVGCRIYAQNEYHRIFQDGNQSAGVLPWADGDMYLSKEAEYISVLAAEIVENAAPEATAYIPKLTIVDRLIALGKLADALTALNSDAINHAIKWGPFDLGSALLGGLYFIEMIVSVDFGAKRLGFFEIYLKCQPATLHYSSQYRAPRFSTISCDTIDTVP